MNIEMVGLQLYSLRDDMSLNPLETLTQLSEMGYRNIEHAGYAEGKFYGFSPREFKNILSDLNLKMPSSHSPFNSEHWDSVNHDFTDIWKKTIEDAAYLEQQYLINPSFSTEQRSSYDELCRQLEIFNLCGELCGKSGIKFGYHNHDFEFKETFNNQTVFEIMLGKTDPSLVMFQLDTGNCRMGGYQAIDLLIKYPNRFESVHLKDVVAANPESSEPYVSTVLTEGVIDLKEIIDTARTNIPSVHFIIEQEHYGNSTPLNCMKENLRKFNSLII